MKEYLWRMNRTTWEHYLNVLSLLEFSEPETDEYEALKDELRSLPGHPKGTTPEDFIRVEVTTVQH